MNIFEQASREKIRFACHKGNLTVEDLWDLTREDLDNIYSGLVAQRAKISTGSLLTTKSTKESAAIDLKLEIVKHIFDTKTKEVTARINEVERQEKIRKINDAIARKQDAALQDMPVEELQKMADAL